MQEFRLIIPVNGTINLSVHANSLEEAIDEIIERQSELETIPNGSLNLELDHIVVIPIDPKTFN
jgi:hypothetical protein